MAISPINISRVSHTLRSSFVVNSLRRTQRDLFVSQARISSGRSFVTSSENPVAAARALDLTRAFARQEQFMANAQQGDNLLAAADSTLTEISDLLVQGSVIAVQTVGDLTTPAERESEAEVVARLRHELVSVANRAFGGRYIFAGLDTLNRPFVDGGGGVAYLGDINALLTRVDDGAAAPISVPGNVLFGALSRPIDSDVDLTPALGASTRLDAITGADGREIEKGVLIFREIGGAGAFSVDLSSADTIGDVVAIINEAATQAGAGLTASLSSDGLIITPSGFGVSITDPGNGVIASGLGIRTLDPSSEPITGRSLNPRLTMLTPVEALSGGDAIDLDSGLLVTNGVDSTTIDLSGAATVQDVINTINNAGVFVHARISEDGTRIDVFNQVSGSSLRIGENGGTTASDLGIRTFDSATSLDRLNFGRGVTVVSGEDDFRITTKDGSTVDVNLDTARTIGDVITLINDAATKESVSVKAEFAKTGNGIVLTDGTSGTGALSVGILNLSIAAMDLGLVGSAPADEKELIGADVNPTRTEGIIGALIDLEKALRADDTQAIAAAGGRLDTLRNDVTRIHGTVGARSQAMAGKVTQMRDAALTTRIFLSQVQDLDYAEAITELQSTLTQFQANLQTSSNLLNLSLLDFLR